MTGVRVRCKWRDGGSQTAGHSSRSCSALASCKRAPTAQNLSPVVPPGWPCSLQGAWDLLRNTHGLCAICPPGLWKPMATHWYSDEAVHDRETGSAETHLKIPRRCWVYIARMKPGTSAHTGCKYELRRVLCCI